MTHAWTSRSLQALLVLPAAALLAPAPALRAQAPDPAYASQDDDYAGESADRYAQVKVLEGDVRIRKSGEAEEALSRGIPVTEGDVVESRGRGVLQLGDGSRVAFGSSTRFQVAALFTGRDGARQVLLRLDYGRLRISVASGDARFRIDTPTGTASLQERSGASVEVDHDRVTRFKLHAGRGSFSNERDRASLGAGERLTIYSAQDSLDRIRSFNTYEMDGFDQWCDDTLVVRRSQSADYVPREIRPYADDLDEHGEWVDVEDVGTCWRPRVSIEWRPYWRGRWGAYAGGMTWISDDPWGYVTFHHGRWGWSSRWGWYWIPGVFYSPAWVAWNWSGGYCGWAPLGYWNAPCHWGYGAWGGGYCWNVVQVGHINAVSLHNRVVVDRNVFSGFNGGTGTTTWTRGAGRPVAPAWRTSPVIATSAEFRNPAQFTRALDRQVQSQRLADYGRQLQASGHVLQTRTHVSRPAGPGEGAPGAGTEGRAARPFEDRSLRQPGPRGRDLDRPASAGDGGVRVDRGQDRRMDPRDRPAEGGRETARPTDRGAERAPANRDRLEQPRPIEREHGAPAPRERRFEDRRPDPPRERPREERQEWRQERRQERAPSTMDRPVAPPPHAERPSSPPPTRNERPSSPPPSGGDRPSGGSGSRGDGRRG
ncbi:MAG: DUF6600 domain-containing protein [Holophagaceae bacterium]